MTDKRHTTECQVERALWLKATREYFDRLYKDPVATERMACRLTGWVWSWYYAWKAPPYPVVAVARCGWGS